MEILIIGSTQYQERMEKHAKKMVAEGHVVVMPTFDSEVDCDELQVCERNLHAMQFADEVHIIWDCRSTGTIFDFGMAFALGKRVKIIYLEPKTLMGVMEKYEKKRR